MAEQSGSKVVLLPSSKGRMVSGGTESFEVHVDGQWIGWVYDARPWKGYRFGAVRWSATHRRVGDEHARWTRAGFLSRRAAVEALTAGATT